MLLQCMHQANTEVRSAVWVEFVNITRSVVCDNPAKENDFL